MSLRVLPQFNRFSDLWMSVQVLRFGVFSRNNIKSSPQGNFPPHSLLLDDGVVSTLAYFFLFFSKEINKKSSLRK